MAEVKAIRPGLPVEERSTSADIIELLDDLRAQAEAQVVTAIAVTVVADGQPEYSFAYAAGEGVTLTGAAQILALQVTHDQAFEDE